MSKQTAVDKARTAWNPIPDWVLALAEECDRTSQNKTADRLKVSGAQVSLVLKKTYSGNLTPIETKVRGELMAEEIICPVLGELAKHQCFDHQKNRTIGTNSTRARLRRTCPQCPHYKLENRS